MAARRPSEVPTDRLAALNAGTAETRNLAEGLAIDFTRLFGPLLRGRAPAAELDALAGLAITRRMLEAGRLLHVHLEPATVESLRTHPSDTVRGAAGYALMLRRIDIAGALELIRPLADDAHFGVREWAWMALRPRIAEDLPRALALLAPWTREGSSALRRFASEATRPRGVWCTQLRPLVKDPTPGLVILEPLRADTERYVQDSVANWLNDASKSQPEWVRELCRRWAIESPTPETDRVRKRALRTVGE